MGFGLRVARILHGTGRGCYRRRTGREGVRNLWGPAVWQEDRMTQYPLMFRYQQAVVGNGFVAQVEIRGRVLAESTDEGFWFSGVNPGDASGGGATMQEAYADFRRCLSEIIFDIAIDGRGFENFKTTVEELFAATDRESEAMWLRAVEEIRSGRSGENFTGLPRLRAEDPRLVKVTEILTSAANASENALDSAPALAA